MVKQGISPDEINGLLGRNSEISNTTSTSPISQVESEVLKELLTVSFGSAAPVLSTFFSKEVSIMASELSIKSNDEVVTAIDFPSFIAAGQYEGAINGLQFLFITHEDVQTILYLVDRQIVTKINDRASQLVVDMVQQFMNVCCQTMSTVVEQQISYSLSGTDLIEQQQEFKMSRFTKDDLFVQADCKIIVGDESNLVLSLCIPVSVVKQLGVLFTEAEEDIEDIDSGIIDDIEEVEIHSMNESNANQPKQSNPTIQQVQFSNFDESPTTHSEPGNLNMLLDIPLQVTVELGRTKKMVKEILEVSPGSIIELDKLAGEPVDILVNNKLIAVGEVVVIDENFGVRVTDILSTADRITKLR